MYLIKCFFVLYLSHLVSILCRICKIFGLNIIIRLEKFWKIGTYASIQLQKETCFTGKFETGNKANKTVNKKCF